MQDGMTVEEKHAAPEPYKRRIEEALMDAVPFLGIIADSLSELGCTSMEMEFSDRKVRLEFTAK